MKSLLLALALISSGVAQAAVQLNVLPAKPVVFPFDLKYRDLNGNDVTVMAPWFSFKLHVFNQEQDPLVVFGMRVTVTGTDIEGNPISEIVDIHPDDYETETCKFANLGTFDVTGNPGGPVFNDKNLFLLPTKNSATTCVGGELMFYIGGLPEIKKNGDLIEYKVRVQPLGWFESGGAPKGRFDGFVNIDTQ